MQIISSKNLSKHKVITRIVDMLVQYPKLMIQVSRMFTDYNTNSPAIQEIKEHANDLFHSPKIKTPTDVNERLACKLISLYKLNSETFNYIRGILLENIVYIFGPFTKGLKRNKVYIEPTIKDGEYIVGESDIKCDFVFYEEVEQPLEFVECKSNISNVISKRLPFKEAQIADQRKIIYLHNVYIYLSETYQRPLIYFACYNSHIKHEKENLQKNWGYPHISILNVEKILDAYFTRKTSR